MKKIFKKRKNIEEKQKMASVDHQRNKKTQAHEQLMENQEEFDSFFSDVLKKLPEKTAGIILNTSDKSKARAEQILAKNSQQFDRVFADFLVGVDADTVKKCHRTVHAASLTAAIIGCSPIPFSDAFLLVPVQLTMMARLHKIFGQSWSESLGKSLSKELVVVGLGKSAVGNLVKFIPGVGTVAGAAINATVASTITEALGWITVKMLNDGEDIFEEVTSVKGQFHALTKVLKNNNSSVDNK